MTSTKTGMDNLFKVFSKVKAIEIALANNSGETDIWVFSSSLDAELAAVDSRFSKLAHPCGQAGLFHADWFDQSPSESGYLNAFEYTAVKLYELIQEF